MPELVDQMYCSQQIVIPPKFPYILKRFCKAAIKTQPYDLLRWSYEYFRALAEHRPPPVKLRLEYPVYSTEGGLTRGCLKVLAQQLSPMTELPLAVVKSAWQGFCLDQNELRRILCLCDVYLRGTSVPFLHFIAVAGGLLTKSLTHTMILLCESLTKEPDGGSAAIPVGDFLEMYKLLAKMDASTDVKYFNGYREGETPEIEPVVEEEEEASLRASSESELSDDYWQDSSEGFQKLALINSHVGRSTRLSVKLNMPFLKKIDRSPSLERAKDIEWENYQRERRGRAAPSEDINKKLREMSEQKFSTLTMEKEVEEKKEEVVKVEPVAQEVEIFVYDEIGTDIPLTFYGEPKEVLYDHTEETANEGVEIDEVKEEEVEKESEKIRAVAEGFKSSKEERYQEMETLFDEIAALVDRFHSANYDLGMVAGRQMSSTSGEFIVQHIEKEIMAYIDDQIAILPDPDLKKKKAKPEEVAMIRLLLENFVDENMHVIVPEVEEVEEEEEPLPEVTQVYAVPGIGPPVDDETIRDFMEYANDVCKVQADLFMPRNIRHFLCPPLEVYEEPDYNVNNKTEEIPTGGVITD